jgi:glycosidase
MGDENHRRATGNYPASEDFSSALNLLLLTLDGTHRTYYGEEIGMRDGSVTWNQGRDKLGWEQSNYVKCTRDFERTPMQWSGVTNGGFSENKTTWLPVSSGAAQINVLVCL